MMKCGFYETDITPPIGSGISAGFWPTKTRSIRDTLYAHAFAAQANDRTIIILSLDIAVIEKEEADQIRKGISEATGVPVASISVCAIHVHTGPIVTDLYQCFKDKAYCPFQRMADARIGAASCDVEGIAFNRRFRMKNGKVVMNPGLMNPEIDCSVDIVDPKLLVLKVDHADGTPMGILANYALHADTVRGPKDASSADFPGTIRANLRKEFGEGFGFLFLPGTSGNVNNRDVTNSAEEQNDHQSIGKILSEAIKGLLQNIETQDTDVVRCVSSECVGHMRRPTLEECEQVDNENIKREMMRVVGLPEEDVAIEVWAARLGDSVIAMMPGEPFAYFGLEVKRRSPFANTFTCELSNASIGYIYTKEGEKQGGYEALPSTYVRMDSDTGYKIVDEAVENIGRLR